MNTEDVVMVECAECSSDVHPDDSYETTHGSTLCLDCVRSCERCGHIGTESDSWCDVDNEMWCQDCTENRAYWCDSCEEYSMDSTRHIADRGAYWCSVCSDDSATYCEDCDEYYADGCDSCQDTRVVHDYSYRPDPIFHSTDKNDRLYFGIEMEIEAPRNYNEASNHAYQLEGKELAYLKQDGSLRCGFEIVTHPMTHDFYKNEAQELWDVMNHLRDNIGVQAWGTGTCGVHIHISRTGFNGGAHMHRFLNLVYSNEAFYSLIAGRSSDRWAKFSDVWTSESTRDENGYWQRGPEFRSFKNKLSDGRNSDRYSAVNTQNHATLEMRIFRGTTKAYTIKSYLDLAHASVEYTRTLTLDQVKNGALHVGAFMDYIESHTDLYPELNERMVRLSARDTSASRQEASN